MPTSTGTSALTANGAAAQSASADQMATDTGGSSGWAAALACMGGLFALLALLLCCMRRRKQQQLTGSRAVPARSGWALWPTKRMVIWPGTPGSAKGRKGRQPATFNIVASSSTTDEGISLEPMVIAAGKAGPGGGVTPYVAMPRRPSGGAPAADDPFPRTSSSCSGGAAAAAEESATKGSAGGKRPAAAVTLHRTFEAPPGSPGGDGKGGGLLGPMDAASLGLTTVGPDGQTKDKEELAVASSADGAASSHSCKPDGENRDQPVAYAAAVGASREDGPVDAAEEVSPLGRREVHRSANVVIEKEEDDDEDMALSIRI